MRKPDHSPVGRILAAILTLALILPGPALALRVQTGLESDSSSELAATLSAGMEEKKGWAMRAFVLGLVLGTVGLTALVDQAPLQAQGRHAPTGRLIWMLSPHGRPGDWDETIRRLKETKGPVVLLLESGVPNMELLRKSHPKVARQLTLEKLVEAKGDLPVDELKEILRAHQKFFKETLEKLQADPALAPPLFRPLMQEISGRKDAKKDTKIEIEQAPFESFLNQLRSDLALEKARETLFRAGDTDAYLRLFAKQHRFQELSIEQRDQALKQDRTPQVLRGNPGATVFGQMGLNHFQGSFKPAEQGYPKLGFNWTFAKSCFPDV